MVYASTSSTSASERLVRRRKSSVSASTGKKPIVAPYSGAMLAMVARSGSDIVLRPVPKNSTNLPTTPCSRSICVTVSVRSVAVTPSLSWPLSRKPTTLGISM